MKTSNPQRTLLATLVGAAGALGAGSAAALNPLEYPDNGSASFSRGGAWLAVANEPIATHYNPAGLATQGSGFSLEQQLNFNKVCYDRRGPDGEPEIIEGSLKYLPACTARGSFPSTIPSISIAGRLSKRVGIGFAIVPPAAYGTPDGAFPATTLGDNTQGYQACVDRGIPPEQCGSPYQQVPSPWRYQVLEQFTTIILPTAGIGVEVVPNLRLGVAFVSGMVILNSSTAAITKEDPPLPGADPQLDHARDDSVSTLKTKDLFVPGVILSAHWSITDYLDVAAWGRYLTPAESSEGALEVRTFFYERDRDPVTGAAAYSRPTAICRQPHPTINDTGGPTCSASEKAIINRYGNETFRRFKLPLPPEVRAGVRFHLPRNTSAAGDGKAGTLSVGPAHPVRDPLKDDVFDVEVDASYTMNTTSNTIEIRFAQTPSGGGKQPVVPEGFVPPNADRWNGFRDSYGVRIGGQYNVIPERLGLRAGTWYETQSQEAEWLHVGFLGAARGGFGGGLVVRQNFIDISVGYQRHWSDGLNNNGRGAMRANVGSQIGEPGGSEPATLANEPKGVSAADRQQFRSYHTVNNGRITQSAHAFTLGGTIRF